MPKIQRTCKVTGKKFFVSELEQALRQKFKAPLPDVCPEERMRLLLNFRSGNSLYMVKCDLCNKQTLSVWGQNPVFPVYCHECYASDNWTPPQADLNLDRPFFEQFKELRDKAPHPARFITDPMENSDYTNAAYNIKDSYMSFEFSFSERSHYCYLAQFLKDCLDVSLTQRSELSYASFASNDSYQLFWCEFSPNCSDSYFLYDCDDCDNCAFSSGLRHQSFVFMNKQLTKSEYKKKIAEMNTGSYKKLRHHIAEFEKMKAAYPKKALIGNHNENVSGNLIYNGTSVENSYDARDIENASNTLDVWNAKDVLDIDNYGLDLELAFSCSEVGAQSSNLQYCVESGDSSHSLLYCMGVSASHDCIGGIYSRKMEFTILNKRYKKAEYEKLRDVLTAKMKERGEWGKMFTPELISLPYNDSAAHINMPLTRGQAEKLGYRWANRKIPHVKRDEILDPPDDIKDISWEDVEGKVILCEKSARPFRVIKTEFDFYKKHNIPLPHLHPEIRLLERYPYQLFFNLHKASCSNCHKEVITSMLDEDILLCDDCYDKKVA